MSAITLDRAIERLLSRRSYRSAFLEGRYAELDLRAGDLRALQSIDRDQLESAARQLRDDVMSRKHRGSGSLATLYERTVASWVGAAPAGSTLADLFWDFLESDAYAAYREIPFAGAGKCVEEAFFRFFEDANIGDPVVREREFLAAIIKALAQSPRPSFVVPAAVRRLPAGYFAIARRGEPELFAAVRGRFVSGKLTPFLANLLESSEARETVAARHGVSAAVLRQAVDQLRVLGFGGDSFSL